MRDVKMPRGVYLHKKGRVITWGDKIRLAHLGTHHTEETKLKISLAQIGKKKKNHPPRSTESRARYSEAVRLFWKDPKYRERMLSVLKKIVYPLKDTSIEIKVEDWLKDHNIQFELHKLFVVGDSFHKVDRYLPMYNMAIECDGEYWHSKPERRAHDEYIDRHLLGQGVKVVRLSESQINSGSFVDVLLSLGVGSSR
jgi:very-short-patch-repair endonuclease